MRKFKPVLILLAIQLVLAIILPFINPACDYIIRTWGEEYIIDISEPLIINGADEAIISGDIYCNPKYDIIYFYHDHDYAVIEPNENGLYGITELREEKPEDKLYLGGKNPGGFRPYYRFTQKFNLELLEEDMNSENPLFDPYSDKEQINSDYKITARIIIFKGKARLDTFLVNGVEIEKFLTNKKVT